MCLLLIWKRFCVIKTWSICLIKLCVLTQVSVPLSKQHRKTKMMFHAVRTLPLFLSLVSETEFWRGFWNQRKWWRLRKHSTVWCDSVILQGKDAVCKHIYKALKSCTTDLQHNGSVKPLMLDLGCWFQCAHGNVFILLSKMKHHSHFMTHCHKKYLKLHNAS